MIYAAARWVGAFVVCTVATFGAALDLEPTSQLKVVRTKISQLETQLTALEKATTDARLERQRLDAELSLAEARVEEIELMLTSSRDEVVELRAQNDQLAQELTLNKAALMRHIEMIALLGRPGPLQLMYDALRGGDLEMAVDTVAVLTSAQVKLIEEFDKLQRERTRNLAVLSLRMNDARREAQELIDRRQNLKTIRSKIEKKVRQLEKQHKKTGNRLVEMRGRAQALEGLFGVVRSRRDFKGKQDIRRYRGALPWPADGTVVQTFGKHYLPKYATYTVCNGIRFMVTSGAEITSVFSGEVAYARHFKGYGNMVVVDHGHDVYSLVAGLATIHVRVGQRVEMGKRLGLAPPPVDDGNLYLEIRVGEKPQDPRRWLRLEEDRS